MVKRLWTASFTFYSAGWVILMLMAFYWVVEVKQIRRWIFPLLVLGMNSSGSRSHRSSVCSVRVVGDHPRVGWCSTCRPTSSASDLNRLLW